MKRGFARSNKNKREHEKWMARSKADLFNNVVRSWLFIVFHVAFRFLFLQVAREPISDLSARNYGKRNL